MKKKRSRKLRRSYRKTSAKTWKKSYPGRKYSRQFYCHQLFGWDADSPTIPIVERRRNGWHITLTQREYPWYGPIKSEKAAKNAALFLRLDT